MNIAQFTMNSAYEKNTCVSHILKTRNIWSFNTDKVDIVCGGGRIYFDLIKRQQKEELEHLISSWFGR